MAYSSNVPGLLGDRVLTIAKPSIINVSASGSGSAKMTKV